MVKKWGNGQPPADLKITPGTEGRYRKIPVVVNAFQTEEDVEIETLEGKTVAEKGDWIIQGVDDEYYPCKADVFAKTYQRESQGSAVPGR